MTVTFRAYRPADAWTLVRIWNAAAGSAYPLPDRALRQILDDNPSFDPSDVVVAIEGGRALGFGYLGRLRHPVAGRWAWRGVGWLQVVAVHADRQRRGIGRAIVERLLDGARADGLSRVGVAGGVNYLFPGAPEDLPAARPFLEAAGFRFGAPARPDDRTLDTMVDAGGVTFDLRGALTESPTTERDRAALESGGLVLRPCRPEEIPTFLDWLADFDLDWRHDLGWFFDHGGVPTDILVLWHGAEVAGFARVVRPGSGPITPQLTWAGLLGPEPGGLGPIGVAESLRGRGIGRALLAGALNELWRRGARDVVIDWTTLLGYYGSYGFAPWKRYRTGGMDL